MRGHKKCAAFLLVLALVCTLLPAAPAQAASVAWDGTTIDVSWYNKTDTKFYISTPEQLMGLAAIVNGIYNQEITNVVGDTSCIVDSVAGNTDTGANGNNLSTDAYHYGADDFNGKTVYLTADLNMGGVYDAAAGTWSGPRYMPIGGQYLMELNDAATKLSSSFCGTLDGQGHYILNIYCDRRCTTGNFGDGTSVGVVGRLGTHDDDAEYLRPAAPTVCNLAITGYIYANRSVGGIVGKFGKTTEGAVVENCANFATVKNTDAKGCGGIVGASWNGGIVRNCYNAGEIISTYACPTGGIAGSNEVSIQNCYNVGDISARGDSYAMAIGTNNGGGTDVNNCYWLTGSAPGGGYYGSFSGKVTELSAADMKAASSELGAAFTPDTGKNNGYPLLTWQASNSVNPTAPPPAPAAKIPVTYSDVTLEMWYAPAVDYVMKAGLFDLTGADTFSPEAPMTRAMLAEALYRLAGSPAADTSPFPDTSAPSAAWAYEMQIVTGMGDGTFSPDTDITREQIATMLIRYADLVQPTSTRGDLSVFPDQGAIAAWARDAASWAVGEGLINGTGEGNFAPQGTATRAQVAQILLNFAN